MVSHCVKQHKAAGDVVVVVFDGLCHRFAHRFESGEMHNRFDFVFLKNPLHSLRVKNVGFIEFKILAGDFFDAVEGFGLGIGEIVHHNDVVSRLLQHDACVRADESGSACD